jgi:CubicO group peptidase (beta-lactamase class C family)
MTRSPAPDLAVLRPSLEAVLHTEDMPGIALAVALGAEPAQTLCVGCDAVGHELAPESLFPVASVTKLATALAVLRLVEAGRLALDDSLAEHLPEAAAARPGVTLRALLSHTAGLPPDLPEGAAPYRRGLTWPALATACLRVPLEREPGTYMQYSNLGLGLLAVIVERQTGQDFAAALTHLVLDPLGIEGYLGAEPPRAPVIIGGIESAHAGTELETFNSTFWRALALPWGGLVTTLTGALSLVQAFSGRAPGILGPEICAEATCDQMGGLPGGMIPPLIWDQGPWGLGPQLRGTTMPHFAPRGAAPHSYGHGGASGCVAWLDPTADVAWMLHGVQAIETGWMVRSCPGIGEAFLAWARAEEPRASDTQG